MSVPTDIVTRRDLMRRDWLLRRPRVSWRLPGLGGVPAVDRLLDNGVGTSRCWEIVRAVLAGAYAAGRLVREEYDDRLNTLCGSRTLGEMPAGRGDPDEAREG
jgi:hypothetical protein